MPRNSRFRRRPNNSGTVVKLSGKRRNPYCARVMSDERDIITGKKKQICIGTFATREEALNALSIYSLKRSNAITNEEARNLAPDLFDKIQEKTQKKIPTFKEIYEILDAEEFSKLSNSARKGYKAWIKHFKSIYDRPINNITLADLQFVFDNDSSKNGTQAHMKVLCSKIFEYAVIHQHISRDDDYTSYIKIADYEQSTKHFAFDIEEIKKLQSADTPETHLMLIYIYTGLRVGELLHINRDNIHIDEKCDDDGTERLISYIVTGSKTAAGKNRIVPIHNDIKQFVIDELIEKEKRLIDVSYEWGFNKNIMPMINSMLNANHTMHDTRVTFASLCQLYKVDVYARKKILGHKLKDITFDIYTTASKNRLWTEINKIKL
ncbi:Site-specific recombinase XerD [Roseburia hominis]|nr:Site-specific recombinase XerD [Roseburia hominis]CUO89367.1 Site-specific recombinase XerD [Catenibacterium mitsuokai]